MFDTLDSQNSAYHEGEGVPFMLRIGNAVPGTEYTFSISYDCARGGGNGFDFLGSYDRDRGLAPALDEEGPGTSIPDATLLVPEDASISFDDDEIDRAFKLWGGSFTSSESGPVPNQLCSQNPGESVEKTYTITVTAMTETLHLLWSGHLASGLDWGEGYGASSIDRTGYDDGMAAGASVGAAAGGDSGIAVEAILPPSPDAPSSPAR